MTPRCDGRATWGQSSDDTTDVPAWATSVVQRLRGSPVEEIVRELEERPLKEGVELLRGLLADESALLVENLLPAYADKLAPVVDALVPDRLVELIARLPPRDAVQALRGGYRTVSPVTRRRVFAGLGPAHQGALLDALALGWDGPREAAVLLEATASTVVSIALAHAAPETRRCLSALLAPPGLDTSSDRRPVLILAAEIAELVPEDAAAALEKMGVRRQVDVLFALEAPHAAAALTEVARRSPERAAEALSGLAGFVLNSEGRRVLHRARCAAVLEHLDPSAEPVVALLAALDATTLRTMLGRCSPRAMKMLAAAAGLPAVPPRPVAHPAVRAAGVRRARPIAGLERVAGRHVRIEERFTAEDGSHPLRVDLLEFDARAVRLEARRAPGVGEEGTLAETVARLGGARDAAPSSQAWAELGLVRLADATAAAGALGGLNGNFYFDFGHIIDARDLGMDLEAVPGLRFGSPVGWYVQDGVQRSPAIFGRTALVVTEDGVTHIRRVGLLELRGPSGAALRWDATNRPRAGGVTLYTGLWGLRTPSDADYVDVSVVDDRVHAVVEGGDAAIPLTGFVLSVPRLVVDKVLPGVRAGDRIEAVPDFPMELGRPRHAMACGPGLLRDGQIDLDLAAEELGEKDTATLPFSLTRSVDRFRGARSFVGLDGTRLVLGAVSGVTLGSGPPRVSAGLTFAELAQLCADLGLQDAMALDGGGSTSVVAAEGHGPERRIEVLNVPTGGADVPEGQERFINTHWLVFDA